MFDFPGLQAFWTQRPQSILLHFQLKGNILCIFSASEFYSNMNKFFIISPRERERDRETETEAETQRNRDRDTERQRDRQRGTEREILE
jgi:hypothetical protein